MTKARAMVAGEAAGKVFHGFSMETAAISSGTLQSQTWEKMVGATGIEPVTPPV
jgi:hypothetical protein